MVAKITSVISVDKLSLSIAPTDIDRELKYESEARADEIFTVRPTIIKKKIALFKKESLKRFTQRVKDNISVE